MKPVRLGPIILPPVTATIVVVLLAMYLVQGLFGFASVGPATMFFEALPLSMYGVVEHYQVWRVVTYALLHSMNDPFHVLLNVFMIGMFGRELESRWGSGRFVGFSLLAVVMGGLFALLSWVLFSRTEYVIGASALAEGLIVAWGLIYRERPIRLFFAIQLKGIHMVGLALFLWLLQAVSASPVSAAAHLGGIAAGFLFAQFGGENAIKLAWAQLMQKLGRQRKPALYVVPKPPPKGNGKEWVN